MSLDGMSALIALEGSRLEGAKMTSQNSAQVGSQVQQQGLQTAEKKQNMMIQKINAEYERDCAAATVKRMESKFAREKASESLAGAIAQIVTAGSFLSNAWDAGADLFGGAQKLGDIPAYMQVKPIDANAPDTKVTISEPNKNQAQKITITGKDEDGKNVAYSFLHNKDGTISDIRAGNFKENEDPGSIDMRSIARGEVPGLMDVVKDLNKENKIFKYPEDGKSEKEIEKLQKTKNKNIEESIEFGLIEEGKAGQYDFNGKELHNGMDIVNKSLNVMVQTAEDAMPYFKAYLDARKKADNTRENTSGDGSEDLVGAIAKLNAAQNKLYKLQQQIDLMNNQSLQGTDG